MTKLLHVFGIVGIAAGLFAFATPLIFFELLAEYTGQPNAHLIRDVGAAYISAGVALSWAAFKPSWRGPLVSVAAIFLLLHALGHLIDLVSGHVHLGYVAIDAVQVFLPALATTALAVYFLRNGEK
ncbi:MAG: DUF4345 family protein [Oceanococcus sp.]